MHPHVLVPEGRFDAEWLLRLADVAEANVSQAPPFTTVFGLVPTENAAVVFTTEALRRLRGGFVALVDGDPAGDGYVQELGKLSEPPQQIVQWPTGWTIEDVIAWVLTPGGQPVVDAVAADLDPAWQINSLADLTKHLKTKNDAKAKVVGLKEDVIAHDVVIAAIRSNSACVARATEVCDFLVQIALGKPHRRIQTQPPVNSVPLSRFDPV